MPHSHNEATCWPWVPTWNALEQDPIRIAVHDLAAKVSHVTWTIHFGHHWDRQVVGEARSDQVACYVKPKYLYGCPDCVLRFAAEAIKYPTVFYLKSARGRSLRVNCAGIGVLETI